MEKMEVNVCRCRFCGYVWQPKVDKPLQCTKCKRYNWEREDG